MDTIKFPYGPASLETPDSAAAISVDIKNTKTYVQISPTESVTLDLVASDELMVGSEVHVDIIQDATGRALAFGNTGDTIVAPDLAGVANDRDTILLQWNGTAFVGGVWAKVVDAA
ncbi:hypothetical protein C900_05365 [Fulvivirga imtechensis AK7]|uniref:Uncharacterized protein n=1 Tax=Fulvivirga imtechensis AK7 TaxID=1237149 RepID=L8JNS7_9BACT|nr:hypothetical protein [Fulvivirga imtechensis]ELR69169.1 hypothetical protein C900_05365 [Fulvivirga imtechensis AK7]